MSLRFRRTITLLLLGSSGAGLTFAAACGSDGTVALTADAGPIDGSAPDAPAVPSSDGASDSASDGASDAGTPARTCGSALTTPLPLEQKVTVHATRPIHLGQGAGPRALASVDYATVTPMRSIGGGRIT